MAIRLSDIPTGTKADIETRSTVDVQHNRVFSTLIDSTDAERGEIRMLAPIDMLTGYRIRPGEAFRLYFRVQDMLLQVWLEAIGYERSNRTIILVAKLGQSGEITTANRRNDFRVRTVLPADVWKLENPPEAGTAPSIPEAKPAKCLTTDISAGGVGLYLTEPVQVGDAITCRVKVEKGDIQGELLFSGLVMRAQERDKTELYRHAAGIRITNISPAHSNLLLQFSLACQREALRMRSDRK